MNAYQKRLLGILFALGSLALFFNNCAGPKADAEGEEAAASQAPPTTSGFSGKLAAKFEYVSTDGRAWGYAMDTANQNLILKVLFYSGGPVGTGTYVGEVNAKEPLYGTYSGHYFSFKVPANLADGKPQKLYAYAVSAKPENLIGPGLINFASYAPKAEAYFNANVAPLLANNCVSCHGWSYRSLYYGPLMNPQPINGGSASNNKLIRKISGGESHGGGGAFCSSGLNAGLCGNIQTWWQAEFQ